MSEARILADNVHRLCRPHTTSVETDDGYKIATLPSLISQLREAISPSGGAGNGGSPTKQRLPLDAHALDVYREIEATARKLLAAKTHRPVRPGPPEAVIISYQAAVQAFGEREIQEAVQFTTKWVGLIEGIMNPVKARRPLQQPCPQCEALWDGAEDRKYALTVWCDGPTTSWDAYCAACEAVWFGDEITYLLRALEAA